MPGPSIESVAPFAFAIVQLRRIVPAVSFVQSSVFGTLNDSIRGPVFCVGAGRGVLVGVGA